MNSENLDGVYLQVNRFYFTDCHFNSFEGSSSSNFTTRKNWLKTGIFRAIVNIFSNILTDVKSLRKNAESLAYAI